MADKNAFLDDKELKFSLKACHHLVEENLIDSFERNGFIGPFESFLSDEKIDICRNYLEDIVSNRKEHPVYGRFSVRDWHLVSQQILNLFTHPDVINRLVQLAGEDLVLWRSKLFYKKPGDNALGWHQEWGYFDGEEIGNAEASLIPAPNRNKDSWWNLTVWVALNDITVKNGPVQLIPGSHKKRYPYHMVPLVSSAFFHDPFVGVNDPQVIVKLAKQSKLVLDIDTSNLFDGVDVSNYTMDEMKVYVYQKLSEKRAKLTPFSPDPDSVVTMTMKKGQFFIFSERTMHGSLPNYTQQSRLGINCRITTTDTLIYPKRLKAYYIDSSNLDISKHHCVLLSGKDKNGKNVYS